MTDDAVTCSDPECDRTKIKARGMCEKHYQRWYVARPDAPRCALDECDKVRAIGNPLCPMHRERKKRHGDPRITKRVLGRDRAIDPRGYVVVRRPDHPAAWGGRDWINEHRVVMEEKLGRYLYPGENVHHINGVRDDNSPGNLELWVKTQPAGQRPADLVEWARTILERYGDMVDG